MTGGEETLKSGLSFTLWESGSCPLPALLSASRGKEGKSRGERRHSSLTTALQHLVPASLLAALQIVFKDLPSRTSEGLTRLMPHGNVVCKYHLLSDHHDSVPTAPTPGSWHFTHGRNRLLIAEGGVATVPVPLSGRVTTGSGLQTCLPQQGLLKIYFGVELLIFRPYSSSHVLLHTPGRQREGESR
jgi:hypothetical protein